MALEELPRVVWPNEKRIVDIEEDVDKSHRAKPRNASNVIILVVLVLLSLTYHRYLWRNELPELPVQTRDPRMVGDFEDITPNEKLQWHPCFTSYQCARLTVPMDYNRPLNASENNPKVHIALLMAPGRNHGATGKYSKSPLLVNPGGPGGSGVSFAYGAAFNLQRIVGLDQDIIGFDPRGIGKTTPIVDCWAHSINKETDRMSPEEVARGLFHRYTWQLSGLDIGIINSSTESLEKLDERQRLAAQLCDMKDAIRGEDSILRHVSTPAVARDMLSIVDAWDSWMDAKSKAVDGRDDEASLNPAEADEDPEMDTHGKLVYWGFSYGTLLGATFAAMFPNRVGRVVLDGVVDADYYVAPVWKESLLDTDAVEASFFKYCHRAGTRCGFYRDGDTEKDLESRFQAVSDNLKNKPIKGINPFTKTPTIITYAVLKFALFQSLYFPVLSFPFVAQVLDFFHRGNEEAILSMVFMPNSYNPDLFCRQDIPQGYQSEDVRNGIMCSDKRYPLNETVLNLEQRFEEMSNISSYADVWMTLMIGCDGWPITATDPPMRWDDHPSHRQKPINTSFPLLFLSNTADPVTPLYAGVKMARKFVGAGLIEQLSEGHCSLSSASLCTAKKVRAYFREGKVPAVPEWGPEGKETEEGKWERCERTDWPWRSGPLMPGYPGVMDEALVADDYHMMEGAEALSRRMPQFRFWGGRSHGVELSWHDLEEWDAMRNGYHGRG